MIKATEPWAGKLRDNRNIGDFRRWKDHDAYAKALERVLRDLKVAQAAPKDRWRDGWHVPSASKGTAPA